MEAAGRIVGRALVAVRDAAVPGATTADLDELVEQLIAATREVDMETPGA